MANFRASFSVKRGLPVVKKRITKASRGKAYYNRWRYNKTF